MNINFNLKPLINMTFKDKIISIINFIIFVALVLSLIFKNIIYILIALVIIILLFYVYLYEDNLRIKNKKVLNDHNLEFYDNKICVKPTLENPFMNPSIIDYKNNNNNIKSCSYITNDIVNDNVDTYFKQNVYKDINDIYQKNFSERQFYTVPATTIPNDRESYEKWLYGRPKTCKENNGEQCSINIGI
jgi:hypothetical protein